MFCSPALPETWVQKMGARKHLRISPEGRARHEMKHNDMK